VLDASPLGVVQAADDTGTRAPYKNRKVFGGSLAYVIQGLYGKGLREGFDAGLTTKKTMIRCQSEIRIAGRSWT